MNRIFFVSPLPPPVHGFSWINSQVFDLLQKKCHVVHFDRNPSINGASFTLVIIIFQLIRFLFKLLIARPSTVYIGWSGGMSMMVDFIYVCLCRFFFVPVCLHHHSFAYLNKIQWYNKLALRPTRNQQHVALCHTMADLLTEKYDIDPNCVTVVSNAAFLPASEPLSRSFRQRIAVGFLSNVTVAKGIFEFIDLAYHFANDDRFQFFIAGPVDLNILEQFNYKINQINNLTYKGAVYSKEKNEFFKKLDVFIFPTKYVNEAEPVTISEALRSGLPVVSIQRGCISSMLGNTGILTTSEHFLAHTVDYLIKLSTDESFYSNERICALDRFNTLRFESLKNLEILINKLSGHRT